MDALQGVVLFLILTVSLVATQSTTNDPVTSDTSSPVPEITFPGNFTDENTTAITVGGVFVRVLGQSGKFIMGRTSNPNEDPNALKVAFDAIRELDKDGAVIGKGGRVKHSFNTFASQSFMFSNITDDQYQNLSAKRLDFVANLTSVGATLTAQMYLFEEEGNITQDDEVSQVSKGTLKFNIVLENWSFCGMNEEICRQGSKTSVGEYIEFVIAIKGKKSGTKKGGGRKKRTNAQEYDMGGDASVVLSGKVGVRSYYFFPTNVLVKHFFSSNFVVEVKIIVKYYGATFYVLGIVRVINAESNFWFYYFNRLGTTVVQHTRICQRDFQKLK